MLRRNGIRLLVAALVVAAVSGAWLGLRAGRAPAVEFTTLLGQRIRMQDLRGHPVLVAFWASDCRACLEEMPDLAELHREYADRGFRLITVAMAYDPPNRVLALARARQLPYAVALDPLGQIAAAFDGVELVPNSFLIGPDGRIALHRLGRLRADEFKARIERMLREI